MRQEKLGNKCKVTCCHAGHCFLTSHKRHSQSVTQQVLLLGHERCLQTRCTGKPHLKTGHCVEERSLPVVFLPCPSHIHGETHPYFGIWSLGPVNRQSHMRKSQNLIQICLTLLSLNIYYLTYIIWYDKSINSGIKFIEHISLVIQCLSTFSGHCEFGHLAHGFSFNNHSVPSLPSPSVP